MINLRVLPQQLTRSLFFLFLVFCGCYSSPEVEVVKVSRNSVEQTVNSVVAGTVCAEGNAELAFGTVGRVWVVNASLGDRVVQGDVLAEVENQDLKSVYQVAQAELDRKAHLKEKASLSQSEIDSARDDVARAKVAFEKSFIKAPFDGVVVELNLEVGQLSQITAITPKPPLRMVDLSPRFVRAEIDENDLDKIAIGQTAKITIAAVSQKKFKGIIRQIIPYVNSLREQERTVQVELTIGQKLDSPENNLKQPNMLASNHLQSVMTLPVGASAEVEIVTSVHENVLTLPTKAIMGRRGSRYLFRLKGNKIQKVDITEGLQNYETTEVLNQVSELNKLADNKIVEGDEIVIPPDEELLKNGDEVRRK
jgi:HlyD family secretion protein